MYNEFLVIVLSRNLNYGQTKLSSEVNLFQANLQALSSRWFKSGNIRTLNRFCSSVNPKPKFKPGIAKKSKWSRYIDSNCVGALMWVDM